MNQKDAFNILKTGRNVFLTGSAGSGKTYVLRQYIRYLKERNVPVAVTASTGIAATHMDGVTIHSWSGIGIKDKITDRDWPEFLKKSLLKKRFRETKVLIIDEVSMLQAHQLDLVQAVARRMTENNSVPFGGMQVILCGDFFQLPPVSRADEPKAVFVFEARAWQELNLKICYLEEQHRQSEEEYLAILNAIRGNQVSPEIIGQLQAKIGQPPNLAIKPTKLYSHNFNVDAENERELARLPGEEFEYVMGSRGREHLVEALKRGCLAPEVLRIKKGARVMFVKNNFEAGYANGTLGTVIDCDEGRITVRTARGRTVAVEPAKWLIEENDQIKAEIIQYPLRLAWAITVHKSQGMSLDAAEVDLSQSFEKGMGYVALSRVRTFGGLSLIGFNDVALQVNKEVLALDQKFRETSAQCARQISEMPEGKLAAYHQEFMARVGVDEETGLPRQKKEKKEKKPKGHSINETKNLLAQKMSIAEIARERGLHLNTITDHIDKIKRREPDFDLSHLKNNLDRERFAVIAAAFKKVKPNDSGYIPLGPVKEILGDDFSYEEIRLARLFV